MDNLNEKIILTRGTKRMKAKSVLSHYEVSAEERDLLREIARMDGYVEVVLGFAGKLIRFEADKKLGVQL